MRLLPFCVSATFSEPELSMEDGRRALGLDSSGLSILGHGTDDDLMNKKQGLTVLGVALFAILTGISLPTERNGVKVLLFPSEKAGVTDSTA